MFLFACPSWVQAEAAELAPSVRKRLFDLLSAAASAQHQCTQLCICPRLMCLTHVASLDRAVACPPRPTSVSSSHDGARPEQVIKCSPKGAPLSSNPQHPPCPSLQSLSAVVGRHATSIESTATSCAAAATTVAIAAIPTAVIAMCRTTCVLRCDTAVTHQSSTALCCTEHGACLHVA